MRKQIAVILGSINLDNQKKILQGLADAAKETGVNLYVFTNYVGMQESTESFLNSYRIMDLPDFHEFDGLIMAINSIHYPPAVEQIFKQIKETNIPVVSIDREFDGMGCVKISSYDAQFKMLEHLILDHGYRDICYVTGPLQNQEAVLRYQAYQDALQKHDIPFDEKKVFQGSFTQVTGMDAANYFLEAGTCPPCIVCGNDAMALGVMEVLEKNGYKFPLDVKVTGFDNGELSEISFPPITTIDKNQYQVGRQAVLDIIAMAEGAKPVTHIVKCKLEKRGSCGCNRKKRVDVHLLREKYLFQQSITERMADMLRNMTADLSIQSNLDAVLTTVQKYITQTGLSDFSLCLCEKEKVFHVPEKNIGRNINIIPVSKEFTDNIYIPISYRNGSFSSYPYFKKGLVIPKEYREECVGETYIVTPCLFQSCCYGYSVCSSSSRIAENSLYYSFMQTIGIALENVRNRMLLEDAIHKLNNMWSYDMLTKLYNRAGFYYEAKTLLAAVKEKKVKTFLLFFDVDGLKKINDSIGHEAGDQLISAMADCIRYNLTDSMLAMRYGGDEFVIFGSYDKESEIDDLIANIHHSIDRINSSGRHPFVLSTSIGRATYLANEIHDLSVLIDLADHNMYLEKRHKKELLENR